MWIYLLIFFLIAYWSTNTSVIQQKRYFMFSMTLLAIFVGISDMLGGYDRYIYCNLFDDIADTVNGKSNIPFLAIFNLYKTEMGYCLWNMAVAHVTSNRYIFIMLTTGLMYYLFYKSLRRHTENPMIALVLFLALTFFFSFTYLRQMLAAAFAWQSLQYIEKKNLKMFLLWILIASSFHNSAIIFLPAYFIPSSKININKITVAFFVCMVIGISGIAASLFDLYANVDAERVAHANYEKVQGVRWEYLAEATFFFYFIRKYYRKLEANASTMLGVYLSLIFCCILLIFIKSENGGRLSWYYLIGLYSLFSSIYASKSLRLKPHLLLIISFCLYARIVFSWGILLYPYKTFFTPGVRKGDFIEMKYEYDHNYDFDKFYR